MTDQQHNDITAQIIADLERGTAPWIRPWTKTDGAAPELPFNATTAQQYHGANILSLWTTATARGHGPGGWLTFKQALDCGGNVRKGEHGARVFRAGTATKETDSGEETFSFMRRYTVFHVSQCDGLPARMYPAARQLPPEPERHARAESFIAATRAEIRHIENHTPMYCPEPDYIALPLLAQYAHRERYYSTNLHELTHWTGHRSRLDRDFARYHDDRQERAAEELVAEIGSAFLCAHLGIQAHLQHDSYVANWAQLLKDRKRAIFTAASKASEAAAYLRRFSETAAIAAE